jgi:hypothetical protein
MWTHCVGEDMSRQVCSEVRVTFPAVVSGCHVSFLRQGCEDLFASKCDMWLTHHKHPGAQMSINYEVSRCTFVDFASYYKYASHIGVV